MDESGYSPGCVKVHMRRWILHVLPYLKKIGATAYTCEIGRRFLFETLPTLTPSAQRRYKRSIRILDAFFQTGNIPKHAKRVAEPPLPGEIGAVCKEFLVYKIGQRCRLITVENYQRLLSYFVTSLNVNGKTTFAQIEESDIIAFLNVEEAKSSRLSTMRQFYRYVSKRHPDIKDMTYIFELMHSTRTSRLPSTYERDEIKAIESHVDRSGPIGKRTYAMLLLSTRLGLRISDIIGLTFDDLDWDRSMLNIIQAKTGRTVELPLLKDVGEAIVSYLKVRPKTSSPNIFVTHVLPYTPMNRSGAARHISNVIVGSNIHTAGRKHGPHSMRFSLATRLLQQGTGLVCISETLGHSGTDVTMNYLRIDINSLTRCMHDVPQVNDNFYNQSNGGFYE